MAEPIHDELCGCKDCDPWHFSSRPVYEANLLREANEARAREIEALKAEVARLEQERADYNATAERRLEYIARLEGLISAITCDEATIADCGRYCAHGYGPLHAEARAIRARQG